MSNETDRLVITNVDPVMVLILRTVATFRGRAPRVQGSKPSVSRLVTELLEQHRQELIDEVPGLEDMVKAYGEQES